MIRYINGRPYAYQCTRENGKPVTRYLGCDDVALSMAYIIEHDAEERRQILARERRKNERIVLRDHRFAGIHRVVEVLFRFEMESLGYRQHHRAEWRKRRTMTAEMTPQTTASPESEKPLVKPEGNSLVKILRRATEGDKEALDQVEALIKTDLGLRQRLIQLTGGPLRAVERKILKGHTNCPLTQIALREEAADLRRDLAGPDASPLEQLLIDRIVINHLALADVELFFHGLMNKDVRFDTLEFVQKCVDRAHQRFSSSVKALTTLRRAAPTSVTTIYQVSLPPGSVFDPETVRTTATVITSAPAALDSPVPTTPDPHVSTETTMAATPAVRPTKAPRKPGPAKAKPAKQAPKAKPKGKPPKCPTI